MADETMQTWAIHAQYLRGSYQTGVRDKCLVGTDTISIVSIHEGKTMKRPKAPAKTAEEVAMERRQTMLLDKEIEEEEDRFRTLARGKYGKASLLSGVGGTRSEAAGSAGATGRSNLSGGRTAGANIGGKGSFLTRDTSGSYSKR